MNNLEKSLQRVFFFSKLFLVFPLKQDSVRFSRSLWFCIISLSHTSLMYFATYYFLFLYPFDTLEDNPVAAMLLISQVSMMLIHMTVSVVYSFISVRELNDVIDDLRYIDILLSNYVITLDKTASLKFTIYLLVFEFFLFVADLLTFQDDPLGTLFLYWWFIITHVLVFQFAGLMDLFLFRFEVLLARLKQLKNRKHPSPKVAIRLSNIHRLLSGAVVKTNKVFSLQLLVYCATCFVSLVASTYFVFFIPSQELNLKNVIMLVIQSSWVIMIFSSFYSAIRRAHNLTKKAKEFNTLLFQLMLIDPTNNTSNDKRLRLHITMKDEIALTACGFFNLDSTLIYSMVAATTSYIVFLVQFGGRTAS